MDGQTTPTVSNGRVLPGRKPNRLKELREAEGLSRSALAQRASLAARTIKRVEEGLPCAPATKGRIAKVFIQMDDGLNVYVFQVIFPLQGGE